MANGDTSSARITLETGVASGPLARRVRRWLSFLPHGRTLAHEDWEQRHKAILVCLWIQMAGLVIFGLWRGYPLWHMAVDGGGVALFALFATQTRGGRRLRSTLASLGLLTGAAVGVHLSGGVIEAHFMYFVVIALLMLYQDWIPFLVALAFVVGEHGLVGYLLPSSVYNHAAGQQDPWLWAGIHGAFVLAASAANLAYWRLSETEHERATVMLNHAARVDGLTGAVNRRGWDEQLAQVLNLARRSQLTVAVAILDMDDFKNFNDSWGHQRGDQLLQRSVEAWRRALREGDVLARYGGDEFGLILPSSDLHGAVTVLERVLQFTPEGQSCSVGVATWDGRESSAELLARVDDALYEGKKNKRAEDRRIYVARTAQDTGAAVPWADRIPRLVENHGIESVYQPIVNLSDGSVFAYEALARPTDDPDCQEVGDMFETARRIGYLRDLDWICRRAAMEGGSEESRRKPLFINVSVTMLMDPLHDADQLAMLVRWARRAPGMVVLEIVEQQEARDLERLRQVIASYRELGFRFALDDVGEGHSTLGLLAAANPDYIKVAGSLTAGGTRDPRFAALRAVMAFAAAQGTTVIAEGIETGSQRDHLRELGITLGQGFLLGRPERQPQVAAARPPARVGAPAGEAPLARPRLVPGVS
ncbi:MAG: EAL domain-containing protein [Candidatus Dormibacteria bacterium]